MADESTLRWPARMMQCRPDRRLREMLLQRRSFKQRYALSSEQSGQAIVEIAIALPVIAAFTFAMIELCLAFYSYCMISESARECTRYAAVRGATCLTSANASCTVSPTTVNSYATQIGWPNLGNGTTTPSTTYPDGNENPGSRVQVTVTYVFPYNIPFAPKGSIRMASTSVMYIVQ